MEVRFDRTVLQFYNMKTLNIWVLKNIDMGFKKQLERIELSQIKRWYKNIGMVNLVLSIVGFFLMHEEEWGERISFLIVANLAYHLFYQTIPRVIKFQKNFLRNNELILSLMPFMLNIFFYFMLFAGAMVFLILLLESIFRGDLMQLLPLCVPLGIMLTALYQLKTIQQEKQS